LDNLSLSTDMEH